MTKFDAYRDGAVHVLSDKCETCVFRPGNKMNLSPGRLKGMVDASNEEQSAIICHSTLYGETEHNAVCRGYFDSFKDTNVTLALAEAMDVIEFDPVPKKEKV